MVCGNLLILDWTRGCDWYKLGFGDLIFKVLDFSSEFRCLRLLVWMIFIDWYG